MSGSRWQIWAGILLVCGIASYAAWANAPDKTVDYARDIAPLFRAKCVSCHSTQKADGGLDLSTKAGIRRGGLTGKFVIPGNADASELLMRVRGVPGHALMPPNAPLPAEQIDLLAAWVTQGASLQSVVDFDSEVRPILEKRCVSCHSPTKKDGGLDLSTKEGIARGGTRGKILVPESVERSLLTLSLRGLGGVPQMPPSGKLDESEIAVLEAWVANGALMEPGVSFASDVLPLLKAKCGTCHSGSEPKAGLDLTTQEGIQRGGMSGALFEPGNPANSLIVRRLRGLDGLAQMPMGFVPLPEEQIGIVELWIASGAQFDANVRPHWAYISPTRPALPPVRDEEWCRNPVDRFVLARLEGEGLRPTGEADREILARRLYLDLTGLPPSIEELDAFLSDESEDAYEKLVDRLLASPHYGERQARIWLDLARYADSNGFEADANRVAWKFRDWVIDAFNRNLPYDQFTIEQIAGDLLPQATVNQLVATGFHRNTMLNLEGGVDPDEARYHMIVDRVNTTSAVWLGLTMECARCHDHKYDPISQKDYFGMYAIFANTQYEVRGDGKIGAKQYFEPTIEVPDPEQSKALADMEVQQTEARTSLADVAKLLDKRLDQVARQLRGESVTWTRSANLSAANGVFLTQFKDGTISAGGANPEKTTYACRFVLPKGTWTAVVVEALPDAALTLSGPGRSESGNFVLSKLTVLLDGSAAKVAKPVADFVQGGYDLSGLADSDPETGWAIYPQYGKAHRLVVPLAQPVTSSGKSEITVEFRFESRWAQHSFGKFRIGATRHQWPQALAMPENVRAVLAKRSWTQQDRKVMLDYVVSIAPEAQAARERLSAIETQIQTVRSEVPTAMVLKENPANGTLKAHVRLRGEFLNLAEEVPATTPAAFPPLAEGEKANRWSLAKWLVSRNNPLTARVEVNRIWEQYFGRGIVETSENFGIQGAAPTHPELLDWLAVEFMENGWDRKAIHRLIVTSSTYRQSSDVTQRRLERDPNNELLSRGPRFRMEAEMIRDNAMASSGLLNRKIGGPSVFPHQPDGIWDTPYSGETWRTSSNGDEFRRGLYTFIKRTAPYPMFLAFDGTSRELCTVRRIRTNTPLQSLALLNDEVFLLAAKGLADRMRRIEADSVAERIRYGFRACTARFPTDDELSILTKTYDSLLRKYTTDPETAKRISDSPEGAAFVLIANVLLNLDETITKG